MKRSNISAGLPFKPLHHIKREHTKILYPFVLECACLKHERKNNGNFFVPEYIIL